MNFLYTNRLENNPGKINKIKIASIESEFIDWTKKANKGFSVKINVKSLEIAVIASECME